MRVIASRRGLAVLLAVALVLGGLVVRELRRARPAAEDRALVPGLDPAAVTAMTWDRAPPVTVSGQGVKWTWKSGELVAHASPRAVNDVLAALRGGRWQRTGEIAAAGKLRAQLSLTTGAGTHVIGIGEAMPGTEQTWIVVGERALLVDSWVARALDPEPLALRETRPVVDAAQAAEIEVASGAGVYRIAGVPRVRIDDTPPLLVRAELVAELERSLEAIEIVRLSRAPADDVPVMRVARLRLAKACPDEPALAWVGSEVGDGCVARATYDAIAAAAQALAGPAEAVAEPRLVPGEIEQVNLAGGHVLKVAGTPEIDGKHADSGAVAELLAVFAAPAEIVAVPAGAAVRATMQATVHGGRTITFELLADDLVRRQGEPVGLRLPAFVKLARPATAYADRSVWNEEPTLITSIKIDDIVYTRGAVIGEWTRAPAGAFDPKRVEIVVAAVAAPRRFPDVESINYTHRVSFTVTPPVGQPITHELGVGRFRCIATGGAATMLLGSATCDALDALAR